MPDGYRHLATLQNIDISGTSSVGYPISATCAPGYYSSIDGATGCSMCGPGTYSHGGGVGCTACPAGWFAPNNASSDCFQCGNGTTTTGTGSAECITSCSFNVAINQTNVTYSLEAISGTDFGPIFSAAGGSWFINVCGNLLNPVCRANSGVIDTPICFINDGSAMDHGNALQFVPTVTEDQLKDGFYMQYTHGFADFICPMGRTATIQFNCATEDTDSSPVYEPVLTDQCNVMFEWKTIYGCPVCNEATDYSTSYGDCIEGKQIVIRSRTTSCNGPIAIASDPVDCKSSIQFPVVAVVLGAIAFVALGVIAIVVFARSRRMSARYTRLQEQISSKGYEMDNLDK